MVLEADVVVEALPTFLALEGSLSRVEAHVGLEVPPLVEGAVTQFAGKRLQSSVHHLVPLQVMDIMKALITILTKVPATCPV